MPADVNHPLQEPQVLHARVSAIGADWTFIRDRLSEVDPRILKAIHSRKYLRPDHASQRLVARISAAIINMSRDQAGDHTVLIKRDPGIAEGPFIAMGARRNVFGARLHPFHRSSASLLRSQRAYRHLGIARNLDAKAAADVGRLHPYAVDVDAQVSRQKLNGE